MAREIESDFPLPIVSRDTFNSLSADIRAAGLEATADAAEDILQIENFELWLIMGHFANMAGWNEDQFTAARHSMSLTHELLRRKAEADKTQATTDQ